MRFARRMVRNLYRYWHRRWIKAHFRKCKSFHNCLKCEGMIKLSDATPGHYRFIGASCGHELGHRLLEMGFLPGAGIKVMENAGCKGCIMVKIKGTKLVLSGQIAERILLN